MNRQGLGWTVRLIDGFGHELGGRPDVVTPTLREFFDPLLLRPTRCLVRVLKSDTHAPLQYRCSVPLSNFTPFYEVVGTAPDSPLYRPNPERVSIW